MYAQLVETGVKRVKSLEEMSPEERNFQEKIDAGNQDRSQELDARGLPPDLDPADFPARPLGNRRHAARRQLGHPRA